MNNPRNDHRSIDERLEALTINVELIAAMQKHSIEQIAEQTLQLKQLRIITEQHGQELRRFHRAMRAAFEGYLSDDGDKSEG